MVVEFIKRTIKFLTRIGVLKNSYSFSYSGRGVSLNQYYSSQHWTQRIKTKAKYSSIAKSIIGDSLEEGKLISEFVFVVFYNSRHDPDNVSGFEKIIMDELKERKNIIDDSKKYYRLLAIIPDDSLPHNTFIFNLIEI